MNSVDERVVELKFYNQQFENGVRTSVASLKDLKSGLDLDGAAKSLSNLDRVGRSFSLAGIAQGVDTISSKFTTLGIIGVTALQNITNSAINAGVRIVSALTIDPIKSGLEEYETKMNSITTILTNTQSKGSTLDDVNAVLQELNEYSDKTIYNFAEMTRNIGTFTAAGVGLKESAIAIKGIANLAAGSGSSSEQASTAMYQLSQALAAGRATLQDWNSVVNAGMGGELFQKALEKTAKELGKGRNMAVSFRDSLQDGWITSDVLIKTLAKFAEDESLVKAATQVKTFTQMIDTMKESVQSGWATSWENIIGNKDEAAALFTSINDGFGEIIGSSAEARNEMLSFWKANGGRSAIIEALANSFKGLQSILKPIGEAFREIFPPTTGAQLVLISRSIRDLTSNFKIGETTASDLKRTFAGMFAILDIGKEALFAIGRSLASVINYLAPARGGFLSLTGGLGDFLVAVDKAIKTSDSFNVAFEKIGAIVKPIADGVKASINAIIDSFKILSSTDLSGLDSFSEHFSKVFEPFNKLGDAAGGVFAGMVDGLKQVAPTFYKFASAIGDFFSKIATGITNAFENADMNKIFEMLSGGLFVTILYGIKQFIGSLRDITDGAGDFLGQFTDILDGVKGSLQAYQNSLNAGTLLKIAISMGILAASLMAISSIDSDKLALSLSAMTAMFIELFGAMAVFGRLSGGLGMLGMIKITTTMIGLSTAILILSHALTVLSKIDQNGIQNGLTAIVVLTAVLVGASKALEKSSGRLTRSSFGFILFGAAIRILVSSVERLSAIDTAGLTRGLISVGILAAELSLFMKVTDLSGMSALKSLGFIALATSIVILAKAVKTFSEIDTGALIKGLAGVGGVLAEIAIFTNLTGNIKQVMSTALALTVLGGAMLIFGKAISNMGSMSWEELSRGLITFAGALTIIVLTMNTIPKNIFIQSLALIDVGTAMTILAKALSALGKMAWDEIIRALTAMGVSLGIIVAMFQLMKNKILDATALIILSSALVVLSYALKTLGSMSLVAVGTSLLALAGAFGVIGLAGLLLAPLTPAILALAAAITLLGVGCLAAGVGVSLLAAGLAALAVSGTAGAVALVAIVSSIVGLIPFILKSLAQGIVDFAKVIADGAPVIADALIAIVKALMDSLLAIIPSVVETLMVLLTKILTTLVDYVPKIVDAGMNLILGFLTGIESKIQLVTEKAIDVLLKFIEGIINKLPAIVDTALRVIITFINGLADAIRNNHDALYSAVGNLITAIVEAVVDLLPAVIKLGGDIVSGIIKGMVSAVGNLAKAAANMAKSALIAAKEALNSNSPSKEFEKLGVYSGQGMVIGLQNMTNKVASTSGELGKIAVQSLSDTIAKVSDKLSSDVDMQPTIRPVIDLTDVHKGLNSAFSGTQSINVDSIRSKAEAISSIGSGRVNDPTSKQTTTSVTQGQNGSGLSVRIDNFINNRAQDVQAFAEELEFYRKQVAVGRGGI